MLGCLEIYEKEDKNRKNTWVEALLDCAKSHLSELLYFLNWLTSQLIDYAFIHSLKAWKSLIIEKALHNILLFIISRNNNKISFVFKIAKYKEFTHFCLFVVLKFWENYIFFRLSVEFKISFHVKSFYYLLMKKAV